VNIGVVTAAWGDYGRFLPEWIESVRAQQTKPSQVTIVDAGMTESFEARHALANAGFDHYRWINLRDSRGMGHAMNTAVAATPTDWILRLDADDTLFSWALADISLYSTEYDVICLGARIGHEDVIPRWISTETVLSHRVSCFSASAYRRSYWEQRPYLEMNDWIDSAFWVGLAHLSAKFRGTRRVGFTYRRHAGSFSHTLTPDQRKEARDQLARLSQRWDLGRR
jgi:glycosyltransferase involved in cell wall biosynthesis